MDTPAIPPAPVENGDTGGQSGQPGNHGDAASIAIERGGLKGGRPRKDGLTPGSPEALEADREKDRARKRNARRGNPPTLPPASPVASPVVEPQAAGVPASAVPWNPGQLAPFFQDVVPAVEEWSKERLAGKAAKVPGIPPELLDEIRRDAAWNPAARAAIVSTGPEVLTKWLNKMGVSGEHAPEVVLATAIGAVVLSHHMLAAKLDKMGRTPAPTPEAPKAESP